MTNHQTTTLQVSGMTCRSCVRHVEHALRAIEGVERVDVALKEGIVTIAHDPSQAPIESLTRAVDEAGYEARESTPSGVQRT